MAAYLVVEVEVKDPQRYEDYKAMVPPTVKAYGGKFLVRGGAAECLEGGPPPARMVVIEFPSVEQAKRWWDSDEYREARNLRQAIAETRLILVEGAPS